MMFSTSPGEALPVRTPANSCCTTSSVFIIFSSASSKMSSRVIMTLKVPKSLPRSKRHRETRQTRAVVREDANFHTYQLLDATVQQHQESGHRTGRLEPLLLTRNQTYPAG